LTHHVHTGRMISGLVVGASACSDAICEQRLPRTERRQCPVPATIWGTRGAACLIPPKFVACGYGHHDDRSSWT
jgi:hypothetical protein